MNKEHQTIDFNEIVSELEKEQSLILARSKGHNLAKHLSSFTVLGAILLSISLIANHYFSPKQTTDELSLKSQQISEHQEYIKEYRIKEPTNLSKIPDLAIHYKHRNKSSATATVFTDKIVIETNKDIGEVEKLPSLKNFVLEPTNENFKIFQEDLDKINLLFIRPL